MADKVELEVTISPDGTVRLVTHGLKGQQCIAETEALEKLLGKVVHREKTSEYYQNVAGAKTVVKGK